MRTWCSPSGKGNTRPRTGNRVPVRGAPPGRAKRLGGVTLRCAGVMACRSCEPGPSSCLAARTLHRTDRWGWHAAGRAGCRAKCPPLGWTFKTSNPPGRPGTKRRVTTATPAKLDFKPPAMDGVEGCADTMSAGSRVSMGGAEQGFNRCDGVCALRHFQTSSKSDLCALREVSCGGLSVPARSRSATCPRVQGRTHEVADTVSPPIPNGQHCLPSWAVVAIAVVANAEICLVSQVADVQGDTPVMGLIGNHGVHQGV